MKIIEKFLTKNPCYTCGRTITPKGLMLHSVGCPQPSAMVFINQWNPPANGREVCVHGFIDGNTGDVYQTYADTSLLERDYGYRPTTTLEEGLKRFVEWYGTENPLRR